MGYGFSRSEDGEKAEARTVIVASADLDFRQRLSRNLAAMRWQVREAGGGAEAMGHLDQARAEALVVDSSLPDLEVDEFIVQMRSRCPEMDILPVDGGAMDLGRRSPNRNELLHAIRQAQEEGSGDLPHVLPAGEPSAAASQQREYATRSEPQPAPSGGRGPQTQPPVMALPEMVGASQGMRELAHMIRLVAPRSTSVLIEGATGTGKELVAKAVHRLSARAGKPFVVLNCAAIPESLLEAELFGHTRGAFTGAVQSRTGRIEAAHGGTLFLDEIGEMPLALQAKMLRFLESGELQRVGDNETLRVDVRVVAATHQPLQQRSEERLFRLDLYHRLAVFPVRVPTLRERMEDVLPLAAHLLQRLGEEMPIKRLSTAAAERLMEHDWPGNVRELAHVLERGAILAEERPEIAASDIRF